MRHVNMFGFFIICVYEFNCFCYSFRLFYFVLCRDFNFVPSYHMDETSYNMMLV